MKVLITGGTGFIGRSLCSVLSQQGHQLTVLTRTALANKETTRYIQTLAEILPSDEFDAVINLAGEPIADKRWTPGRKQRIIESRINTTQALLETIHAATVKPKVLISGSAIGYYGVGLGSEKVDESAGSDQSFSSILCQKWEAVVEPVQQLGIRTCLLRTGIVLGDGGALAKMIPPFKFALGGKIGSGQQWMPWIHIDDMVAIIVRCLDDNALSGPINCTAPHPVTNSDFTRALGKALRRPTFLPLPEFAIKILMGEMGEQLLVAGKKVVPAKLLDADFSYKYTDVESALVDVVG